MQLNKYQSIRWILPLLFALVHGKELTLEDGRPPKHGIIGGTPGKGLPLAARIGHRNRNPLQNKTNWFCGGTLISDRVVLTAAHCFYEDEESVNIVRLGELEFHNNRDDAQPEDFEVLKITAHPGFHYPVLYNDIGMIHLRRPVIFNIYKQPACLPLEDGNRNPVFVAIGWGQHSVSSFHQSKWLIQVDLHNFGSTCVTSITPNDDLPEGYKGESQLCVGSQEHKDTCNGDSGGPLLIPHPGNGCVHQVMGITSFGIGCDTPGTPGVYTRVYHYLDWIRRELGKSQ